MIQRTGFYTQTTLKIKFFVLEIRKANNTIFSLLYVFNVFRSVEQIYTKHNDGARVCHDEWLVSLWSLYAFLHCAKYICAVVERKTCDINMNSRVLKGFDAKQT